MPHGSYGPGNAGGPGDPDRDLDRLRLHGAESGNGSRKVVSCKRDSGYRCHFWLINTLPRASSSIPQHPMWQVSKTYCRLWSRTVPAQEWECGAAGIKHSTVKPPNNTQAQAGPPWPLQGIQPHFRVFPDGCGLGVVQLALQFYCSLNPDTQLFSRKRKGLGPDQFYQLSLYAVGQALAIWLVQLLATNLQVQYCMEVNSKLQTSYMYYQ